MFGGKLGLPELLVILVIALIIFGPSKIAELGKGLGEGIKNFKSAVKDGETPPPDRPREEVVRLRYRSHRNLKKRLCVEALFPRYAHRIAGVTSPVPASLVRAPPAVLPR